MIQERFDSKDEQLQRFRELVASDKALHTPHKASTSIDGKTIWLLTYEEKDEWQRPKLAATTESTTQGESLPISAVERPTEVSLPRESPE